MPQSSRGNLGDERRQAWKHVKYETREKPVFRISTQITASLATSKLHFHFSLISGVSVDLAMRVRSFYRERTDDDGFIMLQLNS